MISLSAKGFPRVERATINTIHTGGKKSQVRTILRTIGERKLSETHTRRSCSPFENTMFFLLAGSYGEKRLLSSSSAYFFELGTNIGRTRT